MQEHLKAYIVIVALSAAVFWLARRAATPYLISDEAFQRRRNAWFLMTSLAFLSFGFWTYIFLGLIACIWLSRRESNPLALYLLLLFAAPPFEKQILGFGVIDHFFSIGHYRMLNLTILLPAALAELSKSKEQRGVRGSDLAVAGLVVVIASAHALNDTASGFARATFYALTDIALPYFVASRSIRNAAQLRDLLATFTIAAVICACVAIFENTRFWLLYESLRGPFNVGGDPWVYLLRGEGVLRAKGAVGNSIALGYVLMIGVAAYAATKSAVPSKFVRWSVVIALAAGLAATVSRGPWVGTVVVLLVLTVLGPNASRRVVLLSGASLCAALFLALTPWGKSFSRYLPFVGQVETGSIDYRSRLLDVSLEVLTEKPWFGDIFYLNNPKMETMRQGQGIIDMVNTYLQVALPFGLVGLGLFLAVFVFGLLGANAKRKQFDPGTEIVGRSVIAATIGALVTIFTVSSISVIPTLYWILAGVLVAYARMAVPSTGNATDATSAANKKLRRRRA
jgi:hypothetical protein